MAGFLSDTASRVQDRARAALQALSTRLRTVPPGTWGITVALGLVLLYGSLLRFEALHRTYGPIQGPGILLQAQDSVADAAAALRPYDKAWERGRYPYRFDPKSYLDAAREMRHPYEARLREPLFVLVTKALLVATDGQDIAVSLGSMLLSCAIIVATFWLGRSVGGRWVGLAAAFLVAISPELVDWGARGYRAELFTLTTVAFAAAAVHMHRRPTPGAGALTGLVGGLACLTRVTSLSFVIPTLLVAVLAGGRDKIRHRFRPVLIATALTALLVGPFLIACWLELGDPLYSISWATHFYQDRAGVANPETVGVMQYIRERMASQPVQNVDSIVRGLTIYPWQAQWRGYRLWSPALATALRYLSVVGILAWLWMPAGRIALLVLATATLPFAFTWEVFRDWRFTMHAHPFLVVAAVHAASLPAWAATTWRQHRSDPGKLLRRAALPVLGSALLVIALTIGFFAVPPLIFYQRLNAGEGASVAASERDALFFVDGWLPPRKEGNVVFRYADGDRASIRLLVPGPGPYDALLRMDPAPGIPGRRFPVSLHVDDWSHRLRIRHGDQVGSYRLSIPAGVLEPGLNRLEIVAGERLRRRRERQERSSAFRFWYIRLWPPEE